MLLELCSEGFGQAQEDAESSIKTDKKYVGGYSLLASVLIEESRGETSTEQRIGSLKRAIESATEAVSLSASNSTERAYAMINRSVANVEYVNYSCEVTADEIRQRLQAAIANARAAAESDTLYQQYAYDSLGNALEDMAWLAVHEPKTNYSLAIAAFQSAVKVGNRDKSRSLMNLGRCRFKAVCWGGMPEKILDSGLDDLQKAVELNPNLAEAYYWRGRIVLFRGHPSEALREFDKCLSTDKENHLAKLYQGKCYVAMENWAKADGPFEAAFNMARTAADPVALDYLAQWGQSIDPTQPGVSAARLPALTAAKDRIVAQSLPKVAEPLLFLGVIAEAQGNQEEAIQKYAAALVTPCATCKQDYRFWLHMRSSEAGCSRLMLLSRQNQEKARDQAAQSGASLLQHADEAVGLAKTNSPTVATRQAAAVYQAGFSRSIVGQLTDNRDLQSSRTGQISGGIETRARRSGERTLAFSACGRLGPVREPYAAGRSPRGDRLLEPGDQHASQRHDAEHGCYQA